MYVVVLKKKELSAIVVIRPAGRGTMPPPSRVYKDKRRKKPRTGKALDNGV